MPKEFENPAGQNAGEKGQVTSDRAGIGNQSVQRDHGRNRREDSQQRKECDAARCRQDPVLRDRPEHAPEDVIPTTCRDVPGCTGITSSTRLTRPREIVR